MKFLFVIIVVVTMGVAVFFLVTEDMQTYCNNFLAHKADYYTSCNGVKVFGRCIGKVGCGLRL